MPPLRAHLFRKGIGSSDLSDRQQAGWLGGYVMELDDVGCVSGPQKDIGLRFEEWSSDFRTTYPPQNKSNIVRLGQQHQHLVPFTLLDLAPVVLWCSASQTYWSSSKRASRVSHMRFSPWMSWICLETKLHLITPPNSIHMCHDMWTHGGHVQAPRRGAHWSLKILVYIVCCKMLLFFFKGQDIRS